MFALTLILPTQKFGKQIETRCFLILQTENPLNKFFKIKTKFPQLVFNLQELSEELSLPHTDTG